MNKLFLLVIGGLVISGSCLLNFESAKAQETLSSQERDAGTRFGASNTNDTSPPLRDLAQMPPKQRMAAMPVTGQSLEAVVVKSISLPDGYGQDQAAQTVKMHKNYVQVVEKATGTSILDLPDISVIWSGLGGACENGGAGDPALVYDRESDRWIISQFARASETTPVSEECFAVSTTGNATGSYYRYAFHLGGNFIDSPHIDPRPDGYHMGDSVYDLSGLVDIGTQFFVFDRSAMQVGAPATFTSPGLSTERGETRSYSGGQEVFPSTANAPVTALTLNLTYDTDANLQAAGMAVADIPRMKAANAFAALQFTSKFTDPINVNILVKAITSGLGGSTTSLSGNTYANFVRNPTVADATTADDATVIGAGGSIPAADPATGTHNWWLTKAQKKAIGVAADDLTVDGTYSFNGQEAYTYDLNNRAVPGKYDYVSVSTHEFSEIMGRISLLGDVIGGSPGYMQMDAFHFTGANTRTMTNGPGRSFSIDNGTTLLKAFNFPNGDGSDAQDWASGTNDSFNAFGGRGEQDEVSAIDLRVMDALGYNFGTPSGTPTPTPTPGGNPCTPTAISVGQTINGTLVTTDCVFAGTTRNLDVYSFSGTAGQQIAISLNSSAFDAYLYLVNPSSQIIAQDDDGGGGTNSRIPATSGFFNLPAAGTYTIYATAFSADGLTGSTGAYTVSFSAAQTPTPTPTPMPGSCTFSNGGLNPQTLTESGVAAPAGFFWSEGQHNTGNLAVSNASGGFGATQGTNRLADNFTLTQPCTINSVVFYGYLTGGAAAPSPFTAYTLQIWNGRPGDPGKVVVFGDTTTNRLASSVDTTWFRTFNTVAPAPGAAAGTTRKIWRNTVTVGTVLPAGTYWVDWASTVTGGASHFDPSKTIAGSRGSAGDNARQLTVSTGLWSDVVDSGNPATPPDVPQDFPFDINGAAAGGTPTPTPTPTAMPTPTPTPTPNPTPTPTQTPVPPPSCGTAPTILVYDRLDDHLRGISAAAPGTITSDILLTGLNTGAAESLSGIDFRPATGQLYGFASDSIITRIVTINTTTGVVTTVGSTIPATADVFFGTDFNPVADRLRIIGDRGSSRRFNPSDGTVAGTDTPLAYVAGDPGAGTTPSIVHIAYDRNNAGAALTTLFGIDQNRDTLVRIGGVDGNPSPNGGQVTTIGPLGVNVTNAGGFDIQGGSGTAYAVMRFSGVSTLFTINLTTGAATQIGPVAGGPFVEGIAVGPCTATAIVDGKVLTSDGRGLRNATVSLTDSHGVVRTATTSSFGLCSFDNVATGETYTIRILSRLYRFPPQTVQVNGNLTLPDFVGLE